MLTPQQIQSIASARGDKVVNANAGTSNGSSQTDPAAAFAQRVGYNPNPVPSTDDSSSADLGDRLSSDFNSHVNDAADAQIKAVSGEESPIQATAHTIGQGAAMVGDVPAEIAKSIGDELPVNDGHGNTTNLTDVLSGLLTKAGHSEAGQALGNFMSGFQKAHPEASDYLGSALNLGSILPVGGAADAGINAAKDVAESASEKGIQAAADVGEKASNVVENAKLAATKGNQIPTLEKASQKIIPVPGDSEIKDPLGRYDEHVATEQTALRDAKADTALGKVGGRIGDAYDQVVKQRQDAGKAMSDELDKFGAKRADVSDAGTSLQKELGDNGIEVNSDTGKLEATGQTKLSTADQALLGKYAEEVHSLGPNPTAKDLDSFIGRLPAEIKGLKASSGITFKTNAERIIGNHLNQLRSSLGSVGTKTYNEARAKYADLSGFLKEGAPFLGKTTQSGDYAKDASLAKSAVQSVLNNGKKDWLLKLEQHTGYPAIDDATLALQAMKDTGDYRGSSLLESLTEGAMKGAKPEVPTSATGMINYALGHGLKAAAGKFAGTPIEQTRRYLQSLRK